MSAPLLIITVRGRPAPQGSKDHKGNGRMVESSKYVKPWRTDVRGDALEALAQHPNWTPLDEPLVVDMVFTTTRPASHYRTGRNAHMLRDTAPRRPHSPPDLSKLARSTEDALTSAGVWRDDARVVEYGRLAKVYAGEDPDALTVPGAVIRVYWLGGAS
jgi:Holliday junction resolvase RusA-like endonuclease